jgi:hypothetical protein
LAAQIELRGHGATVQVIGHLIPLESDSPYLVRSHSRPDLSFAESFPVAGDFRLTGFLESSTQKPHRRLPVDVLGSTPINTDLDGRGFVEQDDARIGFVPMLASCSAPTSEGLLDVTRVNHDFVLGRFFQHRNRDG